MKANKDKRICFRLENNDYEIITKLAKQENKSVSFVIRQQTKEIIKYMEE